MSLYVVTGGAGFIGSNIVHELIRQGQKVRVLDNLSTGRKENLSGLDIEFLEGDIRDEAACRTACRNADFVIHQAAFISVPASIEDPALAAEINVTGTLRMMLAAKEARVKRFVYASSCAVYGNAKREAVTEEDAGEMLSPYAASKYTDEIFGQTFTACYGLPVVGLRYFNVYGPRQDPKSPYAAVIPCFIGNLADGRAPTINGDGLQTRDFVFVQDVARANLLACQARLERHEVFNVASGKSTSIKELAEILISLTGADLRVTHGPERPGDIRDSRADLSKTSRMLGFAPTIELRDGLAKTLAWFQAR